MIDLFYRRPSRVSSTEVQSWPEIIDPDGMRNKPPPAGIPVKLSFDRVVDGYTCYPCRLHDFMFYLRFVEYSAENLRFYLWYQSYCEQFDKLTQAEKELSPPFVEDTNPRPRGDWMVEADEITPPTVKLKRSSGNGDHFDIDDSVTLKSKPYFNKTTSISEGEAMTMASSRMSTLAGETYSERNNLDQQPFRSEVSRVASLFLYSDSPLELNLSARDRHLTLRALNNTTHPSAFLPALLTAERFLRWQSHPNFVRRQLSNANEARTRLMAYLGVFCTIAMLTTAIPLILSSKGRGWRVFPAARGANAFESIFCRRRDFCIAYWSRGGRRSTEPWDAIGSENVDGRRRSHEMDETTQAGDEEADAATIDRVRISITHTRTASSNTSFIQEFEFPGERQAAENVKMFESKGVAGKGFEIGVKVRDRDIRRIQMKIYAQMWLVYLAGLGVLCGILIPLPGVRMI